MSELLLPVTTSACLQVYCWQYVNCLELWAKVLAAQGGDELRPLVYPVAQLLVGAVRLLPTPRYFPLRLRLMRSLVNLSKVTGYFIPTAPLLLEVCKPLLPGALTFPSPSASCRLHLHLSFRCILGLVSLGTAPAGQATGFTTTCWVLDTSSPDFGRC